MINAIPQLDESKKDVSNRWLNFIYDSLIRLEEDERRMRNGCLDLVEFFQLSQNNKNLITDLQINNMKFMLDEFDILLHNVRSILTKEKYDRLREKLKLYTDIFKGESKVELFKVVVSNADRKNRTRSELTPAFNKIADDLGKLRAKLVQNLDHILFIKDSGEPE